MIQLYFLSIICNGLSGYLLFSGNENANEGEKAEKTRFSNHTFHLVLGILSAVVGVLKLLSPNADKILILGDLLPSAGGIAAGFLLLFGICRQDTLPASIAKESPTQDSLNKLGVSLLRYRKSIGLGLLAVAFLHFLFPETLFL